jgi:uncharacterized membrane protein
MKPLKLNKQKKPSKFKEKIKNFFKIPEEVFEEEPSPKFEKIKLITLTRNKIYLLLALFLIIVNVLVGFDINFLYLRQILGFLFLILVPGLLITLCFKIRTVKFWEFLVYTIGLSIAFIMFAGLAVNWTLPALNITDKPLSLYPILICFNLFLITLGIVGYKRNKDFIPFQLTVPKLDALNSIFFIIPMTFPVLAILGAFLLNNHGSNILTMIMLGSIAIYVLLLTIFRKRLNENIWPWVILIISLALLLISWLRGWFVSGVDTNIEYNIFQLIKYTGYWDIPFFPHEYNSCLSVNIFPSILSIFSNINDISLFKLNIPIIFSIVPVGIYLLLKNYLNNRLSFIPVFFFISQLPFIGGISIPIRQEIAFIFFILIILILFDKQIPLNLRKIFFIIFGFSMIVSHYSTAYVAIILFLFVYLTNLIFKKKEKSNLPITLKLENMGVIRGISLLILLLFTLFWYSQLTDTTENVANFFKQTFQNMGKIFTEEVRDEELNLNSQFNIFYTPENPSQTLQDYNKELVLKYANHSNMNLYSPEDYKDYLLKLSYSDYLPLKVNRSISFPIYLFEEIIKKLMKIFILIGAFYLLFFKPKNKNINKEYLSLIIGGIVLIFFIFFLPYASLNYDLDRLYQQSLVLLGLPLIFGGLLIFKFIKNINNRIIIIFIIFLLYFLFNSGFIGQIIGGGDSSIKINNFGRGYDEFYVHQVEINSAIWFENNYNEKSLIYVDRRAIYKLWLNLNPLILKSNIIKNLFPPVIDKYSYVYSSYTNTIEEKVFLDYKKGRIMYNFPTQFLNKNKNKIYNSGGSEIFK